jgi:Na+/glutamate symporter
VSPEIALPLIPSLLAACLVLVAGGLLTQHIPLLARYSIPAPIESAVIAGAFCGFAMGATATAIANMQALCRRHGPAPQAFVVVPLVGAFFIDLMNLAVLTIFLLPGFIVGR